jgi:hypothetical protein
MACTSECPGDMNPEAADDLMHRWRGSAGSAKAKAESSWDNDCAEGSDHHSPMMAPEFLKSRSFSAGDGSRGKLTLDKNEFRLERTKSVRLRSPLPPPQSPTSPPTFSEGYVEQMPTSPTGTKSSSWIMRTVKRIMSPRRKPSDGDGSRHGDSESDGSRLGHVKISDLDKLASLEMRVAYDAGGSFDMF